MSTYRINKNKENPYVTINKDFLKRPDMSMRAKGLLAYLLSLPDDWQIKRKELTCHFSNGLESISAALQELVKTGYIVRFQIRDDDKRFSEMIYDVYETPHLQGTEPQTGFREPESRDGENRVTESRPHTK